jgi:hypothetical protein
MNNLNFNTWSDAVKLFAKRIIKSDNDLPELTDCVKYLYALYRRHFGSADKQYLFDQETNGLLEELLERYDHPINLDADNHPVFTLKNSEGFLIVFTASLETFIKSERMESRLDDIGFSRLVNRLLVSRRHRVLEIA